MNFDLWIGTDLFPLPSLARCCALRCFNFRCGHSRKGAPTIMNFDLWVGTDLFPLPSLARCCVLRCFNFRCAKSVDIVGKVRSLS